ncbi:hypothetical protein LPTSP4_35140 [Leptospira ryugenii]|uniref:Uncharacterized protein n=1 Tax=Leptospira ryugenii TaxID=1917863 RepID=A0A2P2E527_9LEPT|nr:hypothetical protein [Leptospira ryugenii]GBF51976.1 hypothetical protein LPTSP4_35140 [Leptospira ryugenii]
MKSPIDSNQMKALLLILCMFFFECKSKEISVKKETQTNESSLGLRLSYDAYWKPNSAYRLLAADSLPENGVHYRIQFLGDCSTLCEIDVYGIKDFNRYTQDSIFNRLGPRKRVIYVSWKQYSIPVSFYANPKKPGYFEVLWEWEYNGSTLIFHTSNDLQPTEWDSLARDLHNLIKDTLTLF